MGRGLVLWLVGRFRSSSSSTFSAISTKLLAQPDLTTEVERE